MSRRFNGEMGQVRGVPLPERIVKNWARVEEFQAAKQDLLIATYPKAGTTWTQEVVDHILNGGDDEKCKRAPTQVRMPFLEMTAADGSNAVAWGSWFEHVKGYWNERHTKKILYIFFEDMKEDPIREVTRIAEFLECQLSKNTIDHIVQQTTFSTMRENPMANYSTIPETHFDRTASDFMRKGEVGDWKNHLTAEQDFAFDEHYSREMAGCSIPIRFMI
ncbi:hypothetical protein DNTS_030297 [Danionella cerebrum]|uniref:Sulfotransferase n=1 Tax=Danionella cerebrum TaxID=2873325 RepID=A0A553RJV7_9TELE|nr:hypothetical protein DNTS_030297 [Danionella translucida]